MPLPPPSSSGGGTTTSSAVGKEGATRPGTDSSHSPTALSAGASKLQSARQRLRAQRELEERRRFGLAPLAVDVEASAAAKTTVEISPNVPQALAQAPWFYQVEGPTLSHQRLDPSTTTSSTVLRDEVDKVVVLGKAHTYTAGACQNCGSRTHRTSECFKAKKRVGAKYTGKVTGLDVQLVGKSKELSYSQKRDRFIGDVGVNLLAGTEMKEGMEMGAEGHDNTEASPKKGVGRDGARLPLEGPGAKKIKTETNTPAESPLNIFSSATAQSHGGLEIKSLPKYLQNLDAMERGEVFFDPRTGSMRGNPNAVPSLGEGLGQGPNSTAAALAGGGTTGPASSSLSDPLALDPSSSNALFQGDLSRYQSGDYHLYVEHQHRFLTGATKSFVDFELDRAVGLLKKKQEEEVKRLRRQHFSDEDEEEEDTKPCDGSGEGHAKSDEDAPVSVEALESAAIALGIPVSQCNKVCQDGEENGNGVGKMGVGIGEGKDECSERARSVSQAMEALFGTKTSTHP